MTSGMTLAKLRKIGNAGSLLAAGACSCACVAMASGFSPMPEVRQTFPSFKACVANLRTTNAEHLRRVKPKTFNTDGGFQEVYLEDRSGGVKVFKHKAARYEARVWYHNGRLLEGSLQYAVSHSWEQTNLECQGKVLITKNASGYTLSTFEPVPLKQS
jgi:hypothetical protein